MDRWPLAGVATIIAAASMLHAQAPTGSGVITGVVRDESGQPIEGARVSAAYRAKRWNGPYRAVAIGRPDLTDDRGMFRLHSLPAGSFVVSVMPERPTGRAYVTYYPSTIEMPDAGVVTVESGKAVDVSIVVNPVQEVPVSGVVRERDGAPAANMDVVLVPEQPHEHFWTGSGSGGPSTRTSTDGLFTLRVRPGRYTLAARRLNAPGPREYAEQVLTVSTEPIAGLTLRTSLGATVSGRLVWEGTDPQPWPRQTALGRIRAATVNTYPLYDVRDFQVSGDGTFNFEGLHGLIRFQEFGLPLGWRIVRVEGSSGVAGRLQVSPGTTASDVRIVMTNRVGWLVAAVHEGDRPVTRATVFILPESPTADTPNAMGFVEVTSPGANVFDLLEGTYLVVAADINGGGLLQDTVLMERARAAATRVPVQARAQTRATVPLTRLHETAERLCACRVERIGP
jgi:hypothetical protein